MLYAKRSYDAISSSDDPIRHLWLEPIEKRWPDFGQAP
jgi:hypothetical protein